MTDEEMLSLRRLHDADCEPWSGDADYGYECICGKTLYLAAEMEPRGLCDDCKERLMAAVPALLDEVDRLRKEDSEWSDLCNQQQALLAERYRLTSPQVCGWCMHAAGDTEEARETATKYTLDEVREHTKICPHNPVVTEAEQLRAQVESDAALVEALAASQTGYDTIRAEADRMRPVYEAAKRVRSRLRNHEGRWNIEEGDLADAIDTALAKESR